MSALVHHESEFLLYAAQDGAVKVRVLFRDETAWLTQRALAELFGVQPPAIAKHLKKQGRTAFGKDYFDDLLERIREIRASERRFYQKVADIYALSADYDARSWSVTSSTGWPG